MKFLLRLLLVVLPSPIFIAPKVVASDVPGATFPESGQLRFIENKGQLPKEVLFNAKIPGGQLFLEKNSFTYFVFNPDDLRKTHPLKEDSVILRGHAWKEIFLGANSNPKTTSISPY